MEVIKHRVRSSGGDFDEHVGEFLREWCEERPEEATMLGLSRLLRSQGFNDTAIKLEDGSYMKRRGYLTSTWLDSDVGLCKERDLY